MEETNDISVTVRPINDVERDRIAIESENWASTQIAARKTFPMEAALPGVAFVLVGVILAIIGKPIWMLVTGFGVSVTLLGFVMPTRVELPPNPWKTHDRIVESTIFPTRVATAIDADGFGMLWCLFDMGDGRWFVLSDEDLPYIESLEDLVSTISRESVTWTRLGSNPRVHDGRPLNLTAEGSQIPHRGIRSYDHLDHAIAAGFVWSPNSDSEFVRQTDLPSWIWSE